MNVRANLYLYQGKELDAKLDIDLYNFEARYYDPKLGRFLSVDPARQLASGYAAMGGNPIVYVDADGHFWQFAIGGAIGGAMNVYSNWDKITNAPSLGQSITRGLMYGGVGIASRVVMAVGNLGASTALSAIGNAGLDIYCGVNPLDTIGNAALGALVIAPAAQGISNSVGKLIEPLTKNSRGALLIYQLQ